jgi:hypothetical protein
VPKEKSHYQVEFCCVTTDNGSYRGFQQFSGYHGEMAVDPANGAILRLTLEADLTPADKIIRSDILVEYGPVEIGGKTYICPLKSVSFSDAPALVPMPWRSSAYRGGALLEHDSHTASMHLRAMLNDVVFEQYHLFHANARMLAGSNGAPVENAASGLAAARPADEGNAGPPDAAPVENAAAGASTDSSPAVAPAATETAPSPLENTAAPAAPEISVPGAAELPDTPATARPSSPGTPLRVTARLVDIGVVAYDKKGHPVTNLKPEDFEIFDNGRRQEIRFFSRAGAAPAEDSAKIPDRVPNQTTVSNRRADANAWKGSALASSLAVSSAETLEFNQLSWNEHLNPP